MEFKDRYTYEDFLDIIAMLRSENGCPWDKVQTHDSLRPCMMEEAAEVLAAIRIYDTTGNAGNLQEELGDVLLQVVMHAQIAKEEGIFTMEDVVNDVAQKMVRRHPHVCLARWRRIPPNRCCRTGKKSRSRKKPDKPGLPLRLGTFP